MSRFARVALLAGLALAGCSREPPPPPPENDAVAEQPPPPPPPVENKVEAPKVEAPAETNSVAVAEPVDDTARTQDDADAVGMTTRAAPRDDDEDEPPVGNEGEGASQ